MGFTPTFQKDPQAGAKLKPGLYALVYLKAQSGAAITGGHVWFRVKEIDRDEGTWTGSPVWNPPFDAGIQPGEALTFSLEQAEAVSAEQP